MKKNFIYNIAYQVLALLIPLVTTPYLSRVLGVDGIGIFSYARSIVTYFSLFAVLGTTTYGQRKIAIVREDKETRSEAFWNIFALRFITSVIILFVYIWYFQSLKEYLILYAIMALNILNVIFDISWFYQGLEDFKKIVIRNTFVKLLNLIAVFVFIKNADDLLLYAVIYFGFTVLGNVVTWAGIWNLVNLPRNIKPFNDIKQIILLFIPTIAIQVYTVLDKSMIGWITMSTYENGCYEQAEKISKIATTVIAAIATVLAPRIANLYNKGEKEQAREYVYKCIRLVWMLAIPMMTGLVAITPTLVPVFLGDNYDKVNILLPVLSIIIIPIGIANVVGLAYLIPSGQQNVYTVSISIAAVLNCVLNYFLIHRFMSLGAAIASVIAEVTGLSLQIIYCIISKQLKFNKLFLPAWRYVVSSCVMLVLLQFVEPYMKANVFSLVAQITFAVCSYFVVLLMLKDDFLITYTKQILSKIKEGK